MILLLAGTSDGRALGMKLAEEGKNILASAATPYGGQRLPVHYRIEARVGKLDLGAMVALCRDRGVTKIVDATHPYAKVATETAKAAAAQLGIAYERHERPPTTADLSQCLFFDTHDQAAAYLATTQGQVFLTVGSNFVATYVDHLGPDRLIARVLPTAGVLAKCEQVGLNASQIIAMQGPFSMDLNQVMLLDKQARFMVTKESSDIGGLREKIGAAEATGVTVLVIRRPK